MKRMSSLLALAVAIALVLLLIGSSALAQSGGGYDLTWNTVDGGGYTFSTGGNYSLGGTVGQADAGVLTGGSYTLVGGFWMGAGAQYKLYLPVLLRNCCSD
jgi:hypothetical protein